MKHETLLKKARHKIRIGKLNEAINIYLKILRKNSDYFNALFMVGTLYAKQGRMKEAIKALEKAAGINPNFPDLQNNLGNAYKAGGDPERAKQCYMNCLKLDPQHASAIFGLGTIFMENFEDHPRAMELFSKALALDPNIPEARFAYGSHLIDLGDQEGLMHLEQAYRLDPHQPGLLSKLGTAYIKFGLPQQAVQYLKSALADNPDDTEARYFLCIAEGKKPDSELQQKYSREVFDKFSGNFEQHLVERLEYKIPSVARNIINKRYGSSVKFKSMVDLGCGTGLGGIAFRDCTEMIVGIDISDKMLQEAAGKNVYDTLLLGEIIRVLDEYDGYFDFFLAADVIIYFQELDSLFTTIRKKALPGSILVFSTEYYDDSGDFIIRESGRVAHNTEYIRRITDRLRMTIVTEEKHPLRKEHGTWIEGCLYICELQ